MRKSLNGHDFYIFDDSDFRAIIKSSRGEHVYACQVTNEVQWCACTGFRVHKKCYHLRVLTELIKKHGEHVNMESNFYKTSVKAINDVFMGGIPQGALVGFYGEPQCGKSTTAIWVLMDVMKSTKRNGVIADTETGLARHFLPSLIERYNQKHNTDIGLKNIRIDYRSWLKNKSAIIPYQTLSDDGKDQQVVVVNIANLNQMSLFVGRPYKVDLDSAKPVLQPHSSNLWENIWDTPLARLMDDPNSEYEYCGFVIDSFTNLMKPFGTNNQVFPARDTAQSVIINQLAEVIDYYHDFVGIDILHASRPPANASKRVKPVGGKSVGHGHKHIIQFGGVEEQGLNTIVHVIPYRLPTELGNKNGYSLTINSKGVH